MASIRRGYSDDFTLNNNPSGFRKEASSSVGIGTSVGQEALDVVGGSVEGQDLKVIGVSSFTAYEGFLRANHEIAENTTLSFDQGPSASLSGEIIVGTGKTVTIDNLPDGDFGPELILNRTFDSNTTGWTANNAVLTSTSNQLKVDDTANAGGWSSASQEVTTEPGAKYRLEVTIGSSTDGSFIGYNAGKYTAGNAPTESFGEFSGGQTTTIEFIAPEKITTIVLVANNDGVSYYDNVSLKKINDLEEPRAGGSEVECLKVFNSFTPPSGGTNERPYAPKPGELYYNYDFKTIEFFDGNGWRQVDNTTTSSRAVFAGGYAPGPSYTLQQSMSSVNIASTGNAVEFGSLVNAARTDHGAMSSAIRGVWHQSIGSPSAGESLDYVALASGGQAADFGDMNTDRTRSAAVSSSTRGLIAGGYVSARINAIDYIQISTVGNALDFGDLSGNGLLRPAPIASPTRGVFVGGSSPSPTPSPQGDDGVQYVTIASKGDSIDFSGLCLFSGGYSGGGVSNGSRGIYGGANIDGSPGKTSVIGYLTLASLGNSQYFGDLSIAGSHHCGTSNHIRGIFNSSDQVPNTAVYSNTIEYVTISTAGNAIDFGDDILNSGRRACTSDSHGGLGGF